MCRNFHLVLGRLVLELPFSHAQYGHYISALTGTAFFFFFRAPR
jgi:hypothetical protein